VSRSRRITAAAVAVVSLTLSLAACGGDATGGGDAASDGKTTLTFVGYGGDGQKAMIAEWQTPYVAKHPEVSFVNTSPPDVSQVKAQVLSGSVTWDVVATAPAAAEQNCGTIFEPLTFEGLDESQLAEQAVGKCYIGNWVLSSPFAYRTEAFPDPSTAPKTIQDFFDVEKFPGRRGMLTNPQNGILEYPLLADGVAPEQMYPLDVDRSLEKLDGIRKVTTFAPTVGALQQAVSAKQVDMFMAPDSRLVPLMNSGVDITIVWDKTVTSLNAFGVPKGSKNVAAAEDFMQFVAGPEASAGIAEALGVSPVNTTAKPQLSENAKKVQVNDPAVNPGTTLLQDVDWYAKNYNEVTTKLTTWLAG